MKKSVLILGFVGVIALSIGFMKNLQSSEVFAETNEGDVSRVVTVEEQEIRENNSINVTTEEQEMRENNPIVGDFTTVITVEEQNTVENSTDQSGFVEQEIGTGFFFEKVK
jgi:hypothetical protein